MTPGLRWLLLPALALAAAPAEEKDYEKHVAELKKKTPRGFHVLVEAPFVVVGDEPGEVLKRRAEGTVRWSVNLLKKEYFEEDPPDIIDIWLFKDKRSYEENVKKIFGEEPVSPYGYYSPAHKALLMNISTGGGTLVHEIVHPFLRANFPACPAWFSEGLASLYEQCCERRGRIRGLTNWRLAGLQEAVRKGTLPSFETLTSGTDAEFYDEDKGANYAQARYLCYYLQGRDLLAKFYRDFLKAREEDPTGYRTLQAVLGRNDMKAFQKEWEAFVLKLKFPE